MFELLTLPVLQMLAAAINFAVMVVQSRPMFVLPFNSLEDVLQATPSLHSRSAHEKHEKRERREKREKRGSHTPMDPMPRVA